MSNVAAVFTENMVTQRDLVIKMLVYEEKIATSEWGQARYRNPLNKPRISLEVEYMFNRKTLSYFGFDTSDQSLQNYRTIFKTYFHSPDDYDKEVIESSYYMRNNRCVFYKGPILEVGDIIPDCSLFNLDGKTKTTLYRAIQGPGTTTHRSLICAFSNS